MDERGVGGTGLAFRFVFAALAVAMLVSTAACAQTPKGGGAIVGEALPTETPSAVSPDASDAMEEAGAMGEGGANEFELRFIRRLSDLGIIGDIVGYDEMVYFAEEVLGPDARRKVPVIYSAIQYFNISEETFREQNRYWAEFNEEHGTAAVGAARVFGGPAL